MFTKISLEMDLIIIFSIILFLAISLFLKKKYKKFSLISFLGAVCVFYTAFIEPQILTVKEYEIDLVSVEKPLRIAIMADIQSGPYRRDNWTKRVAKKIIQEKPDIILFAGDYIENNGGKIETEIEYLSNFKLLNELNIPKYAIFGNHEYGVGKKRVGIDAHEEVKNKLKNLDFKILKNELAEINLKNQKFYIYGTDDYLGGEPNFEALKNTKPDFSKIVLSHNPFLTYEAEKYNPELIISGHTHGGQIRLPFIGPIGKIEDDIPKEWYQGLNYYKNTKLLVTSGAGESLARVRFLNPPEIVILTIR